MDAVAFVAPFLPGRSRTTVASATSRLADGEKSTRPPARSKPLASGPQA
jgi:hypothetical protein